MVSDQLSKVLQMIKEMHAKREQAGEDLNLRRIGMEENALFPSADETKCDPVDTNGVPAEWITADNVLDERVLMYLHGGGYIAGSINTHRELVARISKASGARCLSVNYRLAPENPYPAAVEDATAAYRWLVAQDINPGHIVIGGDSAGGGLTLAALVALRDSNDPLPAAGVCISPWVDMEITGESMATRAEVDPMVHKEDLINMAKAYVGDADPKSPLASPIYADLRGFPPLLIQVGNSETLLDDSTRIASRARAAGVKVDLQVWDEMPHVWHMHAPILPEGQQAIERIGQFIRDHTM